MWFSVGRRVCHEEGARPETWAEVALMYGSCVLLNVAGEAVVRSGLPGRVGRRLRRGGAAVTRASARALLGLSRRLGPEAEVRLREKAAEARAAAEAGG